MKKIILIVIALILAFAEMSYGAPAAGDIMYRDANLNWVSLPIGAEGNALVVSSGLPDWGSGGLSGTAASYLSYYGADPTGVGDSTTAINNWLAYLAANGQMGVCEPGTYKFTSALTAVTGSNWGFTSPGGPATCRLIYTGAATDVDLMTLGDGSNDYTAVYINGLRIDSLTTMTAGNALHIKRVHRSRFDNVWMAGQDGSTNLWNGVYFDVIDTDYYSGINNKVQDTAILIKGAAAGQAGLWLNTGRILSSACGIKVGGGFGGLYIDNLDIIVNTYNVIIDNSLAAAGNREVFFGPNAMLDSAGVTNLHINDTAASTGTIIFDGWNCSSTGKGIDINSWPSGNVQISAGRHFNNGSDAIYIGDNTTNVLIGSGVSIDLNTGWGVNGVSTTLLRSWANTKNNTAGNYHANVANQHVLDGNLYMENEDHIYMKDGDGNYSSALTTMFGTGASVLMVGAGFDATFVMNELYMYNNKNFYMQDGDGNNSSALVAKSGVGVNVLTLGSGFASVEVPSLTASLPVFTDSDKYLVSVANQTAINTLTAVSGATNEHVLTKDTATGNAIYKAAAGATAGGGSTEIQYNSAGAFAGSTGLTYQNDTITLTSAGTNANLLIDGKAAGDYGIIHLKSATVARAAFLANNAATYIDSTGTLTFRTIGGTSLATLDASGDFWIADRLYLDNDKAIYMKNSSGSYVDALRAVSANNRVKLGDGFAGGVQIEQVDASEFVYSDANAVIVSKSKTEMLALLDLEIGTDVQAYNSYLTGINQNLTTTSAPTFNGITLNDPIVIDNNTSINTKTTGGTAKSMAIMTDSNHLAYGYLAPENVYLGLGATQSNPVYLHVNGSDYNVTISAAECGGTGKRCLIITP